MSSTSCKCGSSSSLHKSGLPMICLVPRGDSKDFNKYSAKDSKYDSRKDSRDSGKPKKKKGFKLLSDDYIKKNFKLPPRPLYLDPLRRPLICFPMADESISPHFTLDRKKKINQAILDGILAAGAQICEPSVFPYANSDQKEKDKKKQEDTELIYILQLPDLEHRCPIHNEVVRTPRFIWHTVKKSHKDKTNVTPGHRPGPGPLNKPKPWLLSRHTDFDYNSQW